MYASPRPTGARSWCTWPSRKYPIEDPYGDSIFVTCGVVLKTVPNAEEMCPENGILVCTCDAHTETLLKRYAHQGTHQRVYNCTIVGEFGNPMTMRALTVRAIRTQKRAPSRILQVTLF